jgi:protein SCO1
MNRSANGSIWNGRGVRLWLVLGVAVLLAGVLGWLRFGAQPVPQGNLAGSSLGGPFTLVNQDGRAVSDQEFSGRWRLIYFGYGFCPDVCPTDLALLGRGLKAFETADPVRAAKVVPIFITIDPKRDTPEVLKPFVAAFHPRLIGLTGSQAQIDVATKAFGVYAKPMATSDPDNYLMDHSAMVYLFGPEGQPIAFLPHDGLSAQAISQLLATHVV